ncbi:MAG: hypothetical protein AAGH40_01385 [Verrucomicrobiota bacterium]
MENLSLYLEQSMRFPVNVALAVELQSTDKDFKRLRYGGLR